MIFNVHSYVFFLLYLTGWCQCLPNVSSLQVKVICGQPFPKSMARSQLVQGFLQLASITRCGSCQPVSHFHHLAVCLWLVLGQSVAYLELASGLQPVSLWPKASQLWPKASQLWPATIQPVAYIQLAFGSPSVGFVLSPVGLWPATIQPVAYIQLAFG